MTINLSVPDIGFEPPLDTEGHDADPTRSHRVNIRWLMGTVLIALFGAGLMSIAIMGTAEHKLVRVAETTPAVADQKPTRDRLAPPSGIHRSDKLVQNVDIASAKRSFKAATTIKVGDKEIIKTRSYTRVATTLLLAGSAGDDVPSFNPMQLISEANNNRSFDRLSLTGDINAQVTLVTRDMAGLDPANLGKLTLTEESVIEQVREAAQQVSSRSVPAILPSPQTVLARALRSPVNVPGALALAPQLPNPFSRIEMKLIQENLSAIDKTPATDVLFAVEERVIQVQKSDQIEAALKSASVAPQQAKAAAHALVAATQQRPVADGDRLKLTFANVDNSTQKDRTTRELVRLALYGENDAEAMVGRKDDGSFNAVKLLKPVTPEPADNGADDEEGGLSVFKSIYETAFKQSVPRFLVDELVRVYSYDVDFQRRVQVGDAMEFFYAEPEDGDKGRGELLYASITLANEKKVFYRYQSTDDNAIDFYDLQGRSARKFLLRMPMPEGQLRSGFGYRRHPVLGYLKLHSGVDWSNKVGTPIFAAGNGTIIKHGWSGGYGNHIEIEHLNGYVTTYSHMSAFARGLNEGSRVRQGQIIGYVGATGLVTGPHLHYEVIVNDNFVDPMAIKLPRGRELDGRQLADFKRERERIDQLIQRAPSKTNLAQGDIR